MTAVETNAIEYAESMIDDYEGIAYRSGVTRDHVFRSLAKAYQDALDETIAHAVADAEEKARKEFSEYHSEYGISIDEDKLFWDDFRYTDETETELTPEAIAQDAEAEARRIREAAEWQAKLSEIAESMEVGVRYRYNAPTLTEVMPIQWKRNNAINELLANGTLVKVERTASNPPFLMLAGSNGRPLTPTASLAE